MKLPPRSAGRSLLLLYSFAWPWDVYQYIPKLGFSLTQCLIAAVIALWIADIALRRELRFPFELAWPVCLAIIFINLSNMTAPLANSGTLLFFAATMYFLRSHRDIEACLWLSMTAGTCTAVLTTISRMGFIFPTAYSLQPDETLSAPYLDLLVSPSLASARDLSTGTLALILCAAIAVCFATGQRFPALVRRRAACYAFLLVCPLLGTLAWGLNHSAVWAPPDWPDMTSTEFCAALVVMWLTARVAAKLTVSRRIRPGPMHHALLCLIGSAGLWSACFSTGPRASHAFLLGLAAAYALSKGESDSSGYQSSPVPPTNIVLMFFIIVLSGVNIWKVFPENLGDPRNYDVTLRRDFRDGRFDRMERRLNFIEKHSPTERKTHWWRAELLLSQGLPHRAATHFAVSLKELQGQRSILPPPSLSERDDFLVRLRDLSSSIKPPGTICAYEKALVAAGRAQGALDALKLRSAFRPPFGQEMNRVPLEKAIAFLLGVEDPPKVFKEWSSGELLALLVDWGAQVTQAPPGMPEDILPLTLTAQIDLNQVVILAASGTDQRRASAQEPRGGAVAEDQKVGEGSWGTIGADPVGWSTSFLQAVEEQGDEIATVKIWPDGGLEVRMVAVLPLLMADTPAIRVWIP